MSNLRDALFPDTNITGYTDKNNQPILIGHKLIDDEGVVVTVFDKDGKYYVRIDDRPYVCDTTDSSPLSIWLLMCEWVEIVVPANEPDTAPVAIAPFSKEHNRAIPIKPIKKGRRNY